LVGVLGEPFRLGNWSALRSDDVVRNSTLTSGQGFDSPCILAAGMGKLTASGVFSSQRLLRNSQSRLRMADGISPELLGRLLDEQGGALALFAAQWTDAPDDCVQEALIELARQRPVPDSPVAWLFRVVKNRAISRARSARRRQRHESQAGELRFREGKAWTGRVRAGEAPAEPFADPDEVAAALASLEAELREVVVARTWGGLGFEQIAELVGCSTSTAHRRYIAGLAALRERLAATCPAPTKTTSHTN
jgi:RNA polymerase sigma factor (sigma-70 family)